MTGVGIVSALGSNATTSFANLLSGVRGVSSVELFAVEGHRCRIAAQVDGLDLSGYASRCEAMAMQAAREALAHAGLERPEAAAVVLGTTTGGMPEAETLLGDPAWLAQGSADVRGRLASYPLSRVTARLVELVASSPARATLSSACSSGAAALALGASWVARRKVPLSLVGGADALCRLTFAGFDALGALDPEPSRPFDAARAGLNLGEGAAFLVLEDAEHAARRSARILAYLDGWALGAEAFHITQPEPSGETAASLISQALAYAALLPDDVDFVNAHGTGTRHNDLAEGLALRQALGVGCGRIHVPSSKPQVGHTLGASGALEAAFTVMCIAAETLPPLVGLQHPDPEIPLRFCPAKSASMPIRSAISTSFGFGGAGAVLAFREPAAPAPRLRSAQRRVYVQGFVGVAGTTAAEAELSAGRSGAQVDPARSRRFDEASAQVALAAAELLDSAGAVPGQTGLVCANAYGNVQRSVAFLGRLFERGRKGVPPAEFPHLVPGALAGNASIYNGLRGPVLGCCDLSAGGDLALDVAAVCVAAGTATRMIAGAVEVHDPIVLGTLAPVVGSVSPPTGSQVGGFVLLGSDETDAWAEIGRTLCAAPGHALSLPTCADPRRAAVFSTAEPGTLSAALAGTSWQSVAQRSAPPELIGEAGSAHWIGVAATALRAGDLDEALVVSGGDAAVRATHLLRVSVA